MRKQYVAPEIVDYGSIADHTFNNPSPGTDDKNPLTMATDKYGEFSHPTPA